MYACRKAAKDAESYTYEDLTRDLNSEIENWQAEREKKKGRRADTVSDVMEDLGEELLDFLEMGLGDDYRRDTPGAAAFQ